MPDVPRWSLAACVLLLVVAAGTVGIAAEEDGTLSAARGHLLRGHYKLAADAYEHLSASHPIEAAAGRACALAAQGRYEDAAEQLGAALKDHPESAELHAARAQLAFNRGDYATADVHIAAALKADSQQVSALWLQAERDRLEGRIDQALGRYQALIELQQQADELSKPEVLHRLYLAAAQFARWKRDSAAFSDLVNHFYPQLVEQDELYWPAHYEAGRLFLEKFNAADAAAALKKALAVNPHSPAVLSALAELAIQQYNLDEARRWVLRALEINPAHVPTLQMQADIQLANFDPQAAIAILERAAQVNPHDERTLGRLAAAYGMVDGLVNVPADGRMAKLAGQVERRNRHCGAFYFALGQALDKGRKYPHAASAFDTAAEKLPQMVGPRGQAGLMYMRLGDEPRARKLLEESFDIDPFNVRVFNSIRVLEILADYATLETEHFIVRYDESKDKLLARYVADYLEAIYPEMCETLGYEPAEKTLFEIFNDARNSKGHAWFSARMVGLPNVHTIAACAGKMVAVTSPSLLSQRFNWARVLKHEFVHVINLQQTHFNIPHWFTEALAVWFENTPRPAAWNEMLARRVPAGEVFHLDTINMAFIRPASSEDWQMAYCQSELYAQYMIERFGEGALAQLLDAYARNRPTPAAIEEALGVELADFEQGYGKYLAGIVAELQATELKEATPPQSFSALQEAFADDPQDADIAAALAAAYLGRKDYARAGKLADRALQAAPGHQQATYVKARLLLLIGQAKPAFELLAGSLDRENPQPDLLRLLAGLKYRSEDFTAAAELYELGRSALPGDTAWTRSLAMVYLKSGQHEKLTKELTRLAEADYDDLAVRKKLTQLALAAENYAAAEDWANQCVQIDVLDGAHHRALARALLGQEKYKRAAKEFAVAIELLPAEETELLLPLAEAHLGAGNRAAAHSTLERLLKIDAGHREAKALLKKLESSN